MRGWDGGHFVYALVVCGVRGRRRWLVYAGACVVVVSVARGLFVSLLLLVVVMRVTGVLTVAVVELMVTMACIPPLPCHVWLASIILVYGTVLAGVVAPSATCR